MLARAHAGRSGASRLQRYAVTDQYTFTPTVGATLFESQQLTHRAGTVPAEERAQITVAAGGALESRTQGWDPAAAAPVAGAPQGRFGPPGPAQPLAANPEIKVSAGRLLALEHTGQPRLLFIDHDHLDEMNTELADRHSQVRLRRTGGPSITLQTGEQLEQASIELTTAPGRIPQYVENECNRVAALVRGEDIDADPVALQPNTADAAAAPEVGEVFAFQSRDPGKVVEAVLPKKDKQVDAQISGALALWQQTEARLAAGLDTSGIRLTEFARSLLPGWATHFEGVIARDGADRVVLANYNRLTELRVEKRRMFADYYARVPAFKQAFLTKIKSEQAAAKKQGRKFTWGEVMRLMDPLVAELRATLTGPVAAQAIAQLESFDSMARGHGSALWYFDMYGAGAQSFQSKWEPAGRGHGGSTRVIS